MSLIVLCVTYITCIFLALIYPPTITLATTTRHSLTLPKLGPETHATAKTGAKTVAFCHSALCTSILQNKKKLHLTVETWKKPRNSMINYSIWKGWLKENWRKGKGCFFSNRTEVLKHWCFWTLRSLFFLFIASSSHMDIQRLALPGWHPT